MTLTTLDHSAPVVPAGTPLQACSRGPLQRVRTFAGRRRAALRSAAESGMTTAEYAVGTLAACAFAGVLWAVVRSGPVKSLIQSVIERALSLAP